MVATAAAASGTPAPTEAPGAVLANGHALEAAEDPFVSKVGELPKFNNNTPYSQQDTADQGDSMSECASGVDGMSEIVDGVAMKEQRQQAKQVIKDFVKEMVKGQKMSVMTQTGQLKPVLVSLDRKLEFLKIKAGSQQRKIALKEIDEIHSGTEVEGIDTPLDELCATLMLTTEDCITFRMVDITARDTFVMCLHMFCNQQK